MKRKNLLVILLLLISTVILFTMSACLNNNNDSDGTDIPVSSINLNVSKQTLYINENLELTATINPNNATNKDINWTSSNDNVATVLDGVVSAHSIGSCVIIATTNNGKVATCSITVEENDNINENLFSFYETENGICVYAYNGQDKDVLIPELIQEKKVVSVLFYSYTNDAKQIDSIFLPKYVEKFYTNYYTINKIEVDNNNINFNVEDNILYNFNKTEIVYICNQSNIENFTIPMGVKSFPSFEGSQSLKSVTFNNDITSINSYTFKDCINLSSVTLSESLCSIGYNAFESCSSLKNIVLPNSLAKIDSDAFKNCSEMQNILLPISVVEIGSNAFEGCYKLSISTQHSLSPYGWSESWNYSNCPIIWGVDNISTNSIFDYVVVNNEIFLTKNKGNQNNVVIPDVIDNKKVVGFGTIFSKDNLLQSISIGCNVKTIVPYSFYKCTSLTEVILSDTIKEIPDYCFANCSSLQSINFPDNIELIGTGAFEYCRNLKEIELNSKLKTIKQNAFIYTGLIEIVIPDSVVEMGDFYCSSIKKITIGEKITKIGSSDFKYCSSLETVIIKGLITEIGEDAFEGCHNLKNINIPETVEIIGSGAFEDCSSLTEIVIPNKIKKLGSYVFAGCSDLEKIILSTSLEEIGYHAFKGCAKLTNIIIPQSVLIIDDYIFRDCTMLNVIFCESTNKPVGWVDGWKNYCDAQVVWGNDWSFVNGTPQIKEN